MKPRKQDNDVQVLHAGMTSWSETCREGVTMAFLELIMSSADRFIGPYAFDRAKAWAAILVAEMEHRGIAEMTFEFHGYKMHVESEE